MKKHNCEIWFISVQILRTAVDRLRFPQRGKLIRANEI